MICPKCKVEMVHGKAILPNEVSRSVCWHGNTLINADNLKIIECLKCPKCGHSDDGKTN